MRGVTSQTTRNSVTRQLSLTEADIRAAWRVVGFLEYGNALDHLDSLISMADKDDLEAIEAIIGQRPEFAVYTTMPEQFPMDAESSRFDGDTGQNTLNSAGKRTGLAWVLALARVEFGAIIAGFTEHPDPYMFVTPEALDYRQSLHLLLEGVNGHYTNMQNAEQFGEFTKNSGNIKSALAFSRRVRIVRSMLSPLMKPGRSAWRTDQADELQKYADDMEGAQVVLNASLRSFLAAQTNTVDSTTTREFVNACGRQLEAERKELNAGTATVRDFRTPEGKR
ncbi:MAG: hypothetical protein ACR2NP_13440 [Pirellulaceae bacterium]